MKKLSIFPVLFIILLVLCSCWDRREINDLALVKAVGIDKTDNNQYEITLQIINPGVVSGKQASSDSPVTTYSQVGKTVLEAIRQISTNIPRRPYLAHLRLIVISEDVAKEGISPFFDLFTRDPEQRPDTYVIVTKGDKARDILEVLTSLEVVPANKLFFSLEISSEIWGGTSPVNITEVVSKLITDGEELTLTGIKTEGSIEEGSVVENLQQSDEPTTIKLTGLSLFKDDRLIGWLQDEESEVFNFITDNIKGGIISIPCKDKFLGIEVIRSKSKLKGKVENNEPKISIDLNIMGNVSEVECSIDLSDVEVFQRVEKEASCTIKQQIEQLIKKVQQEYKTDIFGFGKAIHQTDPKKWKEMKENWEEWFETMDVQVNVTTELKHKGMINNLFIEDMK